MRLHSLKHSKKFNIGVQLIKNSYKVLYLFIIQLTSKQKSNSTESKTVNLTYDLLALFIIYYLKNKNLIYFGLLLIAISIKCLNYR